MAFETFVVFVPKYQHYECFGQEVNGGFIGDGGASKGLSLLLNSFPLSILAG